MGKKNLLSARRNCSGFLHRGDGGLGTIIGFEVHAFSCNKKMEGKKKRDRLRLSTNKRQRTASPVRNSVSGIQSGSSSDTTGAGVRSAPEEVVQLWRGCFSSGQCGAEISFELVDRKVERVVARG